MKLIKIIISLTLVAILTSCSESVPEKVTSNLTSESYDWKKWDCHEYGYGGKYLLTIGYIPELKVEGFYEGKLFLKDATAPIDILYSRQGVQHRFVWVDDSISGLEQSYQISIESDGTGRFYDFTGVEEGIKVNNKETYECTSSDLEKFNQFMESIW
jgi:hypothetical protein